MTTITPLAKDNGDGYVIQPAGMLLILADTARNHHEQSTPSGRSHAQTMIDAMLTAARQGGYLQTDILTTLLERSA